MAKQTDIKIRVFISSLFRFYEYVYDMKRMNFDDFFPNGQMRKKRKEFKKMFTRILALVFHLE